MDAQTLRDKRAKLIADARAIRTRADQETRDLTAEEIASQTAMVADAGRYAEELRTLEALEREERTTLPDSMREAAPAARAAMATTDRELRTFLRTAPSGTMLTVTMPDEARTMSTLGLAAGGASIAPDTSMYGQIVQAMKFYGGVEAFGATVLNTETGADLPIATDDDTSNTGTIVAEEGSHASGTDVTMGQKILKGFVFSSKIIKFSMPLEQDAGFPLVPYLAGKIGTRLGRIQNTKFTTGLGVNEPQGAVTAATVGRTGATGFSTTVDFDELKRAKHSVDIAYRNGARWMFNDTTALAISLIKDGNGRYLLQDSVREGDVQMLLGHPVVINNDMVDMAASVKPILFGQGSAYYIRRVRSIQIVVLRELYAANGQVGILGFMRADGGLIDAGQGPVKVWKNSAS